MAAIATSTNSTAETASAATAPACPLTLLVLGVEEAIDSVLEVIVPFWCIPRGAEIGVSEGRSQEPTSSPGGWRIVICKQWIEERTRVCRELFKTRLPSLPAALLRS